MEPVNIVIEVKCVRCGAVPRQVFILFRKDYNGQRPIAICGECVARAAAELGDDAPDLKALVDRFGLRVPGERL